MRKLMIISVLFIFACVMAFSTRDTKVYIEKNESHSVYHYDKSCSAIHKDKNSLEKVTLADAMRDEVKVCEIEAEE